MILKSMQWLYAATMILTIYSANIVAKEHKIAQLDIAIDVPDGFISAKEFAGFIQPRTFSTIEANEQLIGFEQAKTQLIEQLDDKIKPQQITIGDHNGILFKNEVVLDEAQFEQWNLLFGDKISTIIIQANYPIHMAKGMSAKIESSLRSTRWLRLASIQLFNGLPFIIDPTEDLKIHSRTSNSMILMDQVKSETQPSVSAMLVISSGTTKEPINEVEKLSKQLLQAKRLTGTIDIYGQEAVELGNIQAFHIKAKSTDAKTGLTVNIFQIVAHQQHKFLLIQGLVEPKDSKRIWPQFEQVAKGLKFKQ